MAYLKHWSKKWISVDFIDYVKIFIQNRKYLNILSQNITDFFSDHFEAAIVSSSLQRLSRWYDLLNQSFFVSIIFNQTWRVWKERNWMMPCNVLLLNEFLFVNFFRKSLKAIEKIKVKSWLLFKWYEFNHTRRREKLNEHRENITQAFIWWTKYIYTREISSKMGNIWQYNGLLLLIVWLLKLFKIDFAIDLC